MKAYQITWLINYAGGSKICNNIDEIAKIVATKDNIKINRVDTSSGKYTYKYES